ncbi:integral membrane protein, partial [Streptomyces sp. SPB78]
ARGDTGPRPARAARPRPRDPARGPAARPAQRCRGDGPRDRRVRRHGRARDPWRTSSRRSSAKVRDEHDPRAKPALVRAGSEGDRAVWAAEGSLRVDRLAGLRPALPEGPYETLGGLVAAELGRVPRAGDTVRVAGWELRVDSADGRRAGRVRLLAPAPDARTKELSR